MQKAVEEEKKDRRAAEQVRVSFHDDSSYMYNQSFLIIMPIMNIMNYSDIIILYLFWLHHMNSSDPNFKIKGN